MSPRSNQKTSNRSAVNLKKNVTSMGCKLEPAIWPRDTGQRIPCFVRCQLIVALMSNIKEEHRKPGAHDPEPPYQLYPWVNPFPYLFIFGTVISAGVLYFPRKWSCFRRHPHNSLKEKWRPKGKADLSHFPFYFDPFSSLTTEGNWA